MAKKLSKVLAIISLSFFSFFLILPARAIDYGNLGATPANPRPDNPRTQSIFVYRMIPGQSISDGIKVSNNSDITQTILVYATDEEIATGGTFSCKQRVEPKNDVGAWINLAKSEVTLAAKETELVPFNLSVPANADAGEHNGCIIIEAKKDQAAPTTGGIVLSFRTGLRVAVLVPGDIVKKIEIVGLNIKPKGDQSGNFIVSPSVRNLGNVSVDTNVDARIKDILGRQIFISNGGYPVLREQTAELNFDMKKPFWGGWYQASMRVGYDANPANNLGESSNPQNVILIGPTIWFYSSPTATALAIELVLLLIIIIIIGRLLLLVRTNRWIAKAWKAQTVSAEDTLETLAKQYGVSWKLIAKANKLKPPFTISAGKKIKLPPLEK